MLLTLHTFSAKKLADIKLTSVMLYIRYIAIGVDHSII